MGSPGSFFYWKIARESGFVHTLVELKQVRMGTADANPEDVRYSFFRKRAEPQHGKKKCAEGNSGQFSLQRVGGFRTYSSEKCERAMDLFRWRKNQAAIMRIKRDQRLRDVLWQIDGDEKSLGFHEIT